MPRPMPSDEAVTYATLPFRSCSGAGCETVGSGGMAGRAGGPLPPAAGVCAWATAYRLNPSWASMPAVPTP